MGLPVIEAAERELTAHMLEGLRSMPGIRVFGGQDPRSPRFHRRIGTVAFSLSHVPYNRVAKELAELGGIGVRDGCFCANLTV